MRSIESAKEHTNKDSNDGKASLKIYIALFMAFTYQAIKSAQLESEC